MKTYMVFTDLVLLSFLILGVWTSLSFASQNETTLPKATIEDAPPTAQQWKTVISNSLTPLNPEAEKALLPQITSTTTIVMLWASWCEYCEKEMSFLNSLSKKKEAKDLTVIGISVEEELDAAQKKAKLVSVGFPLYYNPKGEIAKAIKPAKLPMVIVYDSKRQVVGRFTGVTAERLGLISRTISRHLSEGDE